MVCPSLPACLSRSPSTSDSDACVAFLATSGCPAAPSGVDVEVESLSWPARGSLVLGCSGIDDGEEDSDAYLLQLALGAWSTAKGPLGGADAGTVQLHSLAPPIAIEVSGTS